MIRLYRINTGSCGGCDIEIGMAVATSSDLAWAASPYEADALLLTGPITRSSRGTLLALLQEVQELPLLAIGRCAIDGHPFGRGGVQAVPDITTRLQLDGCPPEPQTIANAIREVFGYQPPQAEEATAAPAPEEAEPVPAPMPEEAEPVPAPMPAPEEAEPVPAPAPGELVGEEEDPAARRARLLQRIKPLRRQAGEPPAAAPQNDTPAAADDEPADETAEQAPAEGEQAAPEHARQKRKQPGRRSSES